jgi:hypothetical protein
MTEEIIVSLLPRSRVFHDKKQAEELSSSVIV